MTSITCLRSSARMGSRSPSFDCESAAHTCIVVSFTLSLGRGCSPCHCSAIFLWVLFGLMGPQSWTLCGPIHWQSLPGAPPQIGTCWAHPVFVARRSFLIFLTSCSFQPPSFCGSGLTRPHCTGTGGGVCVKGVPAAGSCCLTSPPPSIMCFSKWAPHSRTFHFALLF